MSIELQPAQLRAIKSYVLSSQDHLLPDESMANIEVSTTGLTFSLNGILRAQLQLTNNSKALVDRIDECFTDHKIGEEQIVYRVCNYREMMKTLRDNNYIDYGYMSTSKNIDDTQRFYQNASFVYQPAFITITIPFDSEVIDLECIDGFENDTYEGEILFKREALFTVLTDIELPTRGLEDIMGREMTTLHDTLRVLELQFVRYLQ